MPTDTKSKTRPAQEIRLGYIKATIWANRTEDGPVRYNVQLRRLYKEEPEGEWKTSDSFSRDDLLIAAKALDMAHSWIHEQAKEES